MYAVEFSHRSGRDLINVAKKRTNIIPIIEDARHPHKYRMLVGEYCSQFKYLKHSTVPFVVSFLGLILFEHVNLLFNQATLKILRRPSVESTNNGGWDTMHCI